MLWTNVVPILSGLYWFKPDDCTWFDIVEIQVNKNCTKAKHYHAAKWWDITHFSGLFSNCIKQP